MTALSKAQTIAVLVEVARRAMLDATGENPIDLAVTADAAMYGAANALDVLRGGS